ncbi:hypothetical protein H8959_007381 [Pygathrix nigripes]
MDPGEDPGLVCGTWALRGPSLLTSSYRDVAFLNLVDPISHDLLVNLARDLQCPQEDTLRDRCSLLPPTTAGVISKALLIAGLEFATCSLYPTAAQNPTLTAPADVLP